MLVVGFSVPVWTWPDLFSFHLISVVCPLHLPKNSAQAIEANNNYNRITSRPSVTVSVKMEVFLMFMRFFSIFSALIKSLRLKSTCISYKKFKLSFLLFKNYRMSE